MHSLKPRVPPHHSTAPNPPVDGTPPYALLFDEFTYREIPYVRRDIKSFLEPTYAWLSQEIVNCGNALNQVLKK